MNKIKNFLRTNSITRLPYRAMWVLKEFGFRELLMRIIHRKDRLERMKKFTLEMQLDKKVDTLQRETVFNRPVKISIVTPLYNTPREYLIEMMESVVHQTYSNWELCLADGSDEQHGYVGEICMQYGNQDSRIKYQKLAKNYGISENTNAAMAMATGDYIGLFDHDDLLHPSVLYYYMKEITEHDADFLYCDESVFDGKTRSIINLHVKPDFGIDNIRANNYICHFTVFSRQLYDVIGGFNSEFDGSQDHDFILRLSEHAEHITHVPKILYYWRSHAASVASGIGAKNYAIDAGIRAVGAHLKRVGIEGAVVESTKKIETAYRIHYPLRGNPLVSIVIGNKDCSETLKQCIDSILLKSTYKNIEIIIVENNSTEQKTFDYYKTLESVEQIKVVVWDKEFNYPNVNNYGVEQSKGEQIILLNNDIEVITPNWIEEMLMYNQREDVGATGAMLYYPNDMIQHAGMIIGIGGYAGHVHKGAKRGEAGYMGRLICAQNLSGVTGACMMVKRRLYEELGGLDPIFKVACNDVDLGLRIREAGYLICWTPHAELYHHESFSRGYEDTPEKQARYAKEREAFEERWGDVVRRGDPYYNPHLALDREDFTFR